MPIRLDPAPSRFLGATKPLSLFRRSTHRDTSIWSPELSGAPGVTADLQDILLLNGGIPRPYMPRRQSRLFQESLQCQPPCTGERLRRRMEGGPTIARGPMPVMEEPQRVGDE